MAISITKFLTENVTDATNPIDWTTGSFTPTNGALLLVVIQFQHNTNTTVPTRSCSGGGWTYTERLASPLNVNSWFDTIAWTAPVTTGASMTITINVSEAYISTPGFVIHVFEITGYDTGDPIGNIDVDQLGNRSGAYNYTLTSTTASTSLNVVWASADEGSIALGGTWTGLASGLYGFTEYEVGYKTGSISTVDFTDLTSGFTETIGFIEINASAIPLAPTHSFCVIN